jgi:hydrogenase maturation protease
MTTTTNCCESLRRAELPPAGRKGCLILGLGNDLLCDDAIGLRVVQEIKPLLASRRDIAVNQTTEMGLALLDLVVGFDRLVLVDAVQTGRQPAGFLHQFHATDLDLLPTFSAHFLGIGEMLALGRKLGLAMPGEVLVLAIEVADLYTVSTRMTPALEAALPGIVEQVLGLISAEWKG